MKTVAEIREDAMGTIYSENMAIIYGVEMTTLTGNAITKFQLITLRAAVRLEARGMKRSRSPSAKTIARKALGLSRFASFEQVIAALTKKIEESYPNGT